MTPAAPQRLLFTAAVAVALWCAGSMITGNVRAGVATCGDGIVQQGETCDDGNTRDDDRCPGDCVVDACSPEEGSNRTFSVSYSPPPGNAIGSITVLVDYPEGRVSLVQPAQPGAAVTHLPDRATGAVADFGHALRVAVVRTGLGGIPEGEIFRAHFHDCKGASPPEASDFTCRVVQASDPLSNAIAGSTCTVTF